MTEVLQFQIPDHVMTELQWGKPPNPKMPHGHNAMCCPLLLLVHMVVVMG